MDEKFEMSGGENCLTESERVLLSELEEKIEHREKQHLRIAWPLREIRDRRLYRETHQKFEEYCLDRWGKRRQVINRYIAAAKVIDDLTARGFEAPETEWMARPLSRLTPDEQVVVAFRVKEEGGWRKVKAKRVEEIAAEIAPPPQPLAKPGTGKALILVTKGGKVGPSRRAEGEILRRLKAMREEADGIQALGAHAVEDCLRALSAMKAAEPREDARRVTECVMRFAHAWKQERGYEPEQGQQSVNLWATEPGNDPKEDEPPFLGQAA